MRIIYFDIDSLRPDHLGCYGYQRPTSPNIDRIADQGIRFENCHASDMPCMPSRMSLFSGRFGIHHGCVAHKGTRAEPFSEGPERSFRSEWGHTVWMRQLRDAGLRTVTFTGFAERHAAWHWLAGFQEIHDTGHFGHEIADDVTPQVLDWLRHNGNRDDWFLHVNLWDVHVPYRTPDGIGNRFEDQKLPNPWLSQEMIDLHRSEPGIRSAQDALFLSYAAKRPDINPGSIETPADFKRMIDGYDTAITYADEHIGRILSLLAELGVEEDTAIIVSADHGECLGELNAYGGHCFADTCTARVPMIIRWPGVTDNAKGQARDSLCYNIDLAATVTELIGAEIPDCWDAQSLTPLLRGNTDKSRDHLVLSQLAQSCQRSVVFHHEGNLFHYIRTYRNAFYNIPEEMLFNVSNDPHELDDLSTEHPELTAQGATKLDDWHEQMLVDAKHGDPLETVLAEAPEQHLSWYTNRLTETGRTAWVERLESQQHKSGGL